MFGSKLKMFFCLCAVGCTSRSFGSEAQRSAEVLTVTDSERLAVLDKVDLNHYTIVGNATPALPISNAVAEIDKMLATLPLFTRSSDQKSHGKTPDENSTIITVKARGGYYISINSSTDTDKADIYMVTVRNKQNSNFNWVLAPGWLYRREQHYIHFSTSGTFGDVRKAFENIKDSFNQKK